MQERLGRCNQRMLFALVLTVVVFAAYPVAYLANVEPGRCFLVAQDAERRADGTYDPDQVCQFACYRFGGTLAWGLFMPANAVDRKLRPEIWGRYHP